MGFVYIIYLAANQDCDDKNSVRAEQEMKDIMENKVPPDDGKNPHQDKTIQKDNVQNEEEIDLDLNDPELANAALKLQAGFRGRFKNRVKKPIKAENEKSGNDIEVKGEGNVNVKGQSEICSNKQTVDVEKVTEIGIKTTDVEKNTDTEKETEKDKVQNKEEIDLDLNDPELANAALKLQAGFRGRFKNRFKKPDKSDDGNSESNIELKDGDNMAVKTQANIEVKGQGEMSSDMGKDEAKKGMDTKLKVEKKENSEEIDLDLNDPELANAALKLQAGFRGRFKNRMVKKSVKVEDEKDGNNSAAPGLTEIRSAVDDKQNENEEVDLDLNDPDLATAALKIQSGFRGRLKNRTKNAVKAVDESNKSSTEDSSQSITTTDSNLNTGIQAQVITSTENVKLIEQNTENSNKSDKVANCEEVDLDLNDPELAAAAKKLQAGFRGRFGKKAKLSVGSDKKDNVTNTEPEHTKSEVKVQNESQPTDTEIIDLDLNDPELANAASKLQAGFRGRFKNRAKKPGNNDAKGPAEVKDQIQVDKVVKDLEPNAKVDNTVKGCNLEQTDEVDLDLNDPDLATAALKIQAGFRGRFRNKTQKSGKVCINQACMN